MPDNIRTALITGAAGFIGSHTVKHFVDQGWMVYALTHKSMTDELSMLQECGKIKILNGDITSMTSMQDVISQCSACPDVIVHCAGHASDIGRASRFRKTNFESVKHLSKLILHHDIKKIVFISTTDVYGLKNFNGQKEDELDYDYKARNNYPKYKILAEKWITENLPPEKYSIIRPAAVWGDDDPTLTKRIKDFLAWSPFIIHFGKWKGQNRWPLVHVSTIAKANFMAAVNPKACGQAINVVDSNNITIDEFYRIIAKKYFPNKRFKTLCLPMWTGILIGSAISSISSLLNLKHPFMDPSLYAVYSVSSNLDFSCDKYTALLENPS